MSDFDEYYEATEPELRTTKQGGGVVNDVVNDVVNFSVMEEGAVKLLLKDSRLTAARLAEVLGVKQRQAQRIIASLKVKAGLKRRGSDKTGEWYFETLQEKGTEG